MGNKGNGKGEAMKQYEYAVRTYSMGQLEERGIVVHPENNIVFACRSDGSCAVHDVGMEQMERLAGLLDDMGRDGWELVQLVFHISGIVSFWKRLSAGKRPAGSAKTTNKGG
jgi:hypothetical protein